MRNHAVGHVYDMPGRYREKSLFNRALGIADKLLKFFGGIALDQWLIIIGASLSIFSMISLYFVWLIM